MFRERFCHFLSYGATDQQTVRTLADRIDGLLVPGTIAAWQREGTGGFVLALSAATANLDYAIDSRFPLFQQALPYAKKSHIALAELLGVPGLVRQTDPSPEDFSPEVVATVASCWASFNRGYESLAGAKFDKYARRLGQSVRPEQTDTRPPSLILPPYLMAHELDDPWWRLSLRLFDETKASVAETDRCVRVVATSNVRLLRELASSVPENRLAVWVSGLDELTGTADHLATYARSIANLASDGKLAFALYGGFFSVLLQNLGLAGSSHGIGYGENRDWIELPVSGPPPSRYYMPQLHRYIQPDEATRLWVADRRLAECDCEECNGDPPNTLDYHSLMKHSVRSRAREIESWSGMTLEAMLARLVAETEEWFQILRTSGLPQVLVSAATQRAVHLHTWEQALSSLHI